MRCITTRPSPWSGSSVLCFCPCYIVHLILYIPSTETLRSALFRIRDWFAISWLAAALCSAVAEFVWTTLDIWSTPWVI